MNMRHVLVTLFTRKDPKRDQLLETSNTQSAELKTASQRLQDTISELIDRNDIMTFRGVLRNAKGPSK